MQAMDQTTTRTREHNDLRDEVTERYNATQSELLAYEDRKLFESSLETLLAKPQEYLHAWCDSVDIAVRARSSTSARNDPGQQLLIPVPTTRTHTPS